MIMVEKKTVKDKGTNLIPDTFLSISVVDNGIGIKKEDKGKIFKLFGLINDQDRSNNTQGIGLGLVISKLVVNKFDGQIDFISEHGSGSTFFFSFEMMPITKAEQRQFFESKEILFKV